MQARRSRKAGGTGIWILGGGIAYSPRRRVELFALPRPNIFLCLLVMVYGVQWTRSAGTPFKLGWMNGVFSWLLRCFVDGGILCD